MSGLTVSAPESTQESSYIPIRVLGKGAFGEAVLYRKTEDNSLVVWKEINLAPLTEKERRDAQNEIDILSMLNHPNVVMYYNHFLDVETLLIEMEYANGGTMYHKIANEKELLDETAVIWYFYQLVSAVIHIHEYGILHRDIKTLNIFLTKTHLIKLGDFGISKMLDSNSAMAQSYVGTPYYMSPELIRGDQYDQKSDIWACGCVLYELLTLKKTFDATNPLRLAAEIVSGDFDDVDKDFYSPAIISIVHLLLDKDPSKRPNAEEILAYPPFTGSGSEIEKKVSSLNTVVTRRKSAAIASVSDSVTVLPVVKAKSTEVYYWGGGKLTPQKLDIFREGKAALEVSAGLSQLAVVTVEKELYTWAHSHGGAPMVGQLGHGDTSSYRSPKKVTALEGQHVVQASCGDEFTVCITEEGDLYTFGSNYYGCLGCGDESTETVISPLLVDFFSSRPAELVSCGDAHVVVLTKNFEVFTWGCGEYGRLGLGSEDDHFSPQKVKMRHVIRSVRATPDGTFLLTRRGRVLACGSNEYNKLGFNNAAAGLRKRQVKISYDIPIKLNFSVVKPLSRHHIVSVAAGQNHSAVLDLYGYLITFGCNKYRQLGMSDYKKKNGVCVVGGVLTGHHCVQVSCGDGFTVVATADSQVYSFGCGDDGRLGMEVRDGPRSNCIAFPRAIFGALHHVSDISSKHWHTIIIAEKILHQKTIGYTAPKPETNEYADEVDSAFYTTSYDNEMSSAMVEATPVSINRPLDESSVPPWLQAELDAEFIPIHGTAAPVVNNKDYTSVSESPSSGVSSQSEIDSLRMRIEELESENRKLKELVDSQTTRIKQLEEHDS
ncbi:serine/threonine-protein kinase Nek9-like [Tubulanus polymorphus]|uniref:serine/threonine-protein kinase Nek9-like n=1 Tax=Tubulanus polymorphus TaxID=672921 RepID=UPI003DA1F6FB